MVPMRIGIWADPSPDVITHAERLGAASIWAPEAWGFDAFTPLAYMAARTTDVRLGTAIAQLGARTPAALAMTAMSMQALSGGRFILGLGTSGPRVMEGWHGVRFGSPVRRTRETIEIVRSIAAGERLSYQGDVYRLPLPDSAGRPIRSMAPPAHIPIYVASLGPANLRMTGEVADGWIGTGFIPEAADAFLAPLREGLAAAGRQPEDVELTVSVSVEITDDPGEAIRRHARGYAFTFGAMGSQDRNFYNDAFARQGFGDAVSAVQKLWLDGRREEAADLVPLEIGERTNLIGTPAMIEARLRAYRAAGVSTLRVSLPAGDTEAKLDTLAQLIDLAQAVT